MTITVRMGLLSMMAFVWQIAFAANTSHAPAQASDVSYVLPALDKHHLEEEVRQAGTGLQAITRMGDLAAYLIQWEGDAQTADSLLNAGIEMASLTYDNHQLLEAYANYLIIMDDYRFSERSAAVIKSLETMAIQTLSDIEEWKCKYALACGYLLAFNQDQAKEYAHQALTLAIQIKDRTLTAKSHLLLGKVHHGMNNNVESIRNYLEALTIAESGQDIELRMKCYSELSEFYNLIKAYDRSIQYKLKELDIAEHAQQPDSMRIMNLKFEMEVIAFNNRTLNEKQLYKIIDFADRNHVERLRRVALIAFRNHLIKQNDFAQLHHLFHEEYPDELAYLKANDTTTFFRLQALFHEYDGNIDSAVVYFEKAARGINRSKDKLRQSSFYLRYGDFQQRNGLLQDARDSYRRAYTIASTLPYYEFMVEASGKLEQLYVQQSDFTEAYKYSVLFRKTTASLDSLLQREQLQLIELENEEVLRQQRIEEAAAQTRRRNNIQYTAITILIATAFVVLMLLGGFKVSPSLIRMVGFVSFIFFFEFLILLFDTWIHHATHGEPWKILAVKILLMCGLLPLHHWVEKKVIHYLLAHKLVINPARLLKKRTPVTETIE